MVVGTTMGSGNFSILDDKWASFTQFFPMCVCMCAWTPFTTWWWHYPNHCVVVNAYPCPHIISILAASPMLISTLSFLDYTKWWYPAINIHHHHAHHVKIFETSLSSPFLLHWTHLSFQSHSSLRSSCHPNSQSQLHRVLFSHSQSPKRIHCTQQHAGADRRLLKMKSCN